MKQKMSGCDQVENKKETITDWHDNCATHNKRQFRDMGATWGRWLVVMFTAASQLHHSDDGYSEDRFVAGVTITGVDIGEPRELIPL